MTFAQLVGSSTTGLIGAINTIVIPIIGALIFLVFVWGIAKYFFFNEGDEKKREEGRNFVLWAAIGMTIYFSAWGLVNLALSTLGF